MKYIYVLLVVCVIAGLMVSNVMALDGHRDSASNPHGRTNVYSTFKDATLIGTWNPDGGEDDRSYWISPPAASSEVFSWTATAGEADLTACIKGGSGIANSVKFLVSLVSGGSYTISKDRRVTTDTSQVGSGLITLTVDFSDTLGWVRWDGVYLGRFQYAAGITSVTVDASISGGAGSFLHTPVTLNVTPVYGSKPGPTSYGEWNSCPSGWFDNWTDGSTQNHMYNFNSQSNNIFKTKQYYPIPEEDRAASGTYDITMDLFEMWYGGDGEGRVRIHFAPGGMSTAPTVGGRILAVDTSNAVSGYVDVCVTYPAGGGSNSVVATLNMGTYQFVGSEDYLIELDSEQPSFYGGGWGGTLGAERFNLTNFTPVEDWYLY